MKHLANENTGHMQFKKNKEETAFGLSYCNLQFFFSPFSTHLCNKLEFLRVRIRAHDKNDLYSRACAKNSWFHPYYHYRYTREKRYVQVFYVKSLDFSNQQIDILGSKNWSCL